MQHKVIIPFSAALSRVRQHLKREGKTLRSCGASSKSREEIGKYYIVDDTLQEIVGKHIDIMESCKSMGLVKNYEELES